jgi:hypothetical protein
MHVISKFRTGAAPAAVAAIAMALSNVPAQPALAADGAPGVARVSGLTGSVSIRRGDTKSAFAAAQNAPINVGDYLSTENTARAEVEFDYATLVRLAPKTQVRFVKLDQDAHELQLAEGTVEMRVLHGLDAHPVVDTPSASIVPDQEGRYRVTVTHDGNTEVTVRSGKAEVQYGDSKERIVQPGSTLLVTGQGAATHLSSIITVAYDDFDRWADARDAKWQTNNNWAYSNPTVVGAQDLSQYGQWTDTTSNGEVWQPADEPAGWSPYADGRWVWEPYYGWTWVGNEPWGYAPYHYGRWAYLNGVWCWVPGDDLAYAPAYVGFFNWGDGLADIGWTPLAPFEAISAWWGGLFGGGGYGGYGGTTVVNNYYGGSGGYGGNGSGYSRGGYGNGSSGSGSGLPYRNGSAPGGAHGINAGKFGAGNFSNIAKLGSGLLNGATAIKGLPSIVPTLANLGTNGNLLGTLKNASPLSSRFAAMTAPAKVSPSFEQQQHAVASAIGRQQPARTNAAVTAAHVSGVNAQAARPQSQEERSVSDGIGITPWDRFDNTRTAQATAENAAPQATFERSDAAASQDVRGEETSRETESDRTAVHVDDAARDDDAWSRFNSAASARAGTVRESSSGEQSAATEHGDRSDIPSYAMHSYSQGGERSASETGERSSSDEERGFSQPMHSFNESAASRSYSEPSRSYSEPSRGYSAPRSYSAPSRSYSAPSRSYSAPSHSYSAPHVSSGGGHSSGSDHSSKHR